jgi:hypothetical protein
MQPSFHPLSFGFGCASIIAAYSCHALSANMMSTSMVIAHTGVHTNFNIHKMLEQLHLTK